MTDANILSYIVASNLTRSAFPAFCRIPQMSNGVPLPAPVAQMPLSDRHFLFICSSVFVLLSVT